MSPTAELRFVEKPYPYKGQQDVNEMRTTLQQKWVQHHIPAGQTSAPFEWRDVPIVKES